MFTTTTEITPDAQADDKAPETGAAQAERKGRGSLWQGLGLATLVAALGYGLHALPPLAAFSPMILSIGLGMGLRNTIGTPASARAGIAFAMRPILRLAIVTLGLQLTAAQVAAVGLSGIAIIVATLVATFAFTTWFGRMIGVERGLVQLIAAGTSICGASAVIATNTVTRAPDEDVAYAVACVTVFGSIAMFAYPLLPGLLHLEPRAFGLWSGASIHEIAQVVAAAFQDGKQAGEFATVAKLSRVMLLAPVVLSLGLAARLGRTGADEGPAKASNVPPVPWFVLGFIALVVLGSLVDIPHPILAYAPPVTTFLLSVALAAMGLETDVARLKAKGLRPACVGLAAFLFIALFSLALVKTIA